MTSIPARLGAPQPGPILHASSTTPDHDVPLEADLQSEVKAGDQVTITLPGRRPRRRAWSHSVGTVATLPPATRVARGGSQPPTVPVHIELDPIQRPQGSLDQAPVTVTITDQQVHNVLAVNVTALLARTGGGYAVEVVDRRRHAPPGQVTPGLFDDAAGPGAGVRLRARAGSVWWCPV